MLVPERSATHLVLMPSYNGGRKLGESVMAALHHWHPVWVVIDGSTDGSDGALGEVPGLCILRRAHNGGKGAAVLHGLREAAAQGFTHALIMDADGQHPARNIQEFMALSRANPQAMVLGQPMFGPDAPWSRVLWRRLSNVLARIETAQPIGDSLFGFRLYPLAPLLTLMQGSRHMQGFDFDPEALVRLCWAGVPFLKRAVRVAYPCKRDGGVSHFRYLRDNLLLGAMHARLLAASFTTFRHRWR
jgi:glycosyltransferase involved in cell wall biosynthesis